MKKLIIKIGDLGEIKLEAQGFKDAGCLAALAVIQEALGYELEYKLKPEAYVAVGQKREVTS